MYALFAGALAVWYRTIMNIDKMAGKSALRDWIMLLELIAAIIIGITAIIMSVS